MMEDFFFHQSYPEIREGIQKAMKSTELAEQVGLIVMEAQKRITGIGAEQYATEEGQKFERMALPDLLTYFDEELLDQINYSVMNLIRVRSLKAHIEERFQEMAEAVRVDNPRYLTGPYEIVRDLVKEYERHGRKKADGL